MAITHLKGEEVNLLGNEVNVSDQAPIVKVVGQDLNEFEIGGAKDVIQVLVVVPSLDTPVCAAETRKFNEEAARLTNVEISVVSLDLPFAMGRFCTTEGIENINVGSDFRNKDLTNAYGLLIENGPLAGIAARAVFVIDTNGIVVYKELCEEITKEPDYDTVMKEIEKLI
ncbi:lipid hydroperoxide peroxidase [Malaciobacter molluscorum LMG 25693]|uniref:Thiol peroxidase n=1 Tax=Malaciobacter molluscorum LMG 25693 TaxID=870501 RepID=A0A2G1DJE8_9BACT|nr:thiol peroxidase [Malaciobacter molluscorum]AXX91593.1 lipid hydroperoxide peroxidase [Malaciobacter molluscorum LMG 25693]PHO18612.1 lipid hydroperoxide peroxidase [Malaciobacter molluscorum LMG 25693]